MSEPLRKSLPGVTEGQEPGEGIASREMVEGGTIGLDPDAAADDQHADPGGHPHEPSPQVPAIPTDPETTPAEDESARVRADREHVRDTGGQDSWGPTPE